jgi:hypothetical protein
MARRWAFATIGLAAGFSGLAIIGTILTGIPRLVLESALVLIPLAFVIVVGRRARDQSFARCGESCAPTCSPGASILEPVQLTRTLRTRDGVRWVLRDRF